MALRRMTPLVGALLLALGLSACASGPGAPASSGAEAPEDEAVSYEVLDGGDAIDAAEISAELGEEPEVALPDAGLVGDLMEREVVVEGDGPAISSASTVVVKQQVHDLGTGESGPYQPVEAPLALENPELPPFYAAALEGVPSGSRVAVVVPAPVMLGTATGAEDVAAMLLILDVLAIESGQAADGEPREPAQDLVEVSAVPGEQPEIAVHSDRPAPQEQVIDVVLAGDGDTVEEGDFVAVQYTGLLFEDGAEFDSSWGRGGLPSAFATDRVVPGFSAALVGQTVGSRVVTVFPPELGYGEQGSGEAVPGGATLVFVVDIVGTL